MANITNSQVRNGIQIAKDFGFELIVELPKALDLSAFGLQKTDSSVLRLVCKEIDLPEKIYKLIQYVVHGITMNDIGTEENAQSGKTIVFYEKMDHTMAKIFQKWADAQFKRATGDTEKKLDIEAKITIKPIDNKGVALFEYKYIGVIVERFSQGKMGNGEGGGKARESTLTFSYDDSDSGLPGTVK